MCWHWGSGYSGTLKSQEFLTKKAWTRTKTIGKNQELRTIGKAVGVPTAAGLPVWKGGATLPSTHLSLGYCLGFLGK